MRARAIVLVALASALVVVGPTHARRAPAPGGRVSMSLPPELVGPATDAHLFAPLLEPASLQDPARQLAAPPLAGFPGWRSSTLRSISVENGGRTWKLRASAPAKVVAEAVEKCLTATAKEGSWPADALRARGTKTEVTTAGDDVVVRFTTPVGPLPELLAGCLLRPSNGTPNGPYVLVTPTLLRWQNPPFDVPPLVSFIELHPMGDRTDLAAGAPDTAGAGTLLAPFPDVVLLLQSGDARKSDPLGLKDAAQGLRGFRQALRADLLLAAYGAGRGTAAEALLPPGIAPARPLPEPQGADRIGPLSLGHLPPGAVRVPLRKPDGDPLLDGVVERLAVLLRARGLGMESKRTSNDELDRGLEVMRWRAPTTDPAIALLALAGRRPEIAQDPGVAKALKDPRLLSAEKEERLAAALAVERALLDAGVVVPLMTAERWFTIDPDLRGVVIRPDGVPLLDDAYWGGSR